jgi:hypothetical protein
MKVGLLVECGREGLEVQLCRRIAELLREEADGKLTLDIVPMDDKRNLIEECATASKNLLDDDCDHVVILWDERPAWPEMHEKLCWHEEREKILEELRGAQLEKEPISLVCIEREFESWLLFDHRMIECTLSRPTHPVRVPKQKHPDRMKNPKGAMMKLFQELAGRRYVDREAAREFVECLTDLSHLRHCKTFCRFEEKLVGG